MTDIPIDGARRASLEDATPGISGVSWGAVLAGVFAAVSVSLILLSLGAGLGFAIDTPWTPHLTGKAAAVGLAAGVWMVIVQWFASAMGGYLTGRLRTRWIGTHTHEVFFRDTANGFIAWAAATTLVAALTAIVAFGAAGKAADVAASRGAGPAEAAFAADADMLFRTADGDVAATTAAREEAARIFAASVANGAMTPDDRAYLVQSAVARAGIPAAVALQRVDTATGRELEAADKARKAASTVALLTALSLLVGAFIACVAAALGGLERDRHP